MTRIRVFIATTEGPVAVQKITPEEPDVPSVACRDGTTEVLAISRDYTRFVNRGTGLVAALTGHGAYRLDLDRPVDGGRSWQLPVLLAHLLEAEGRLAGPTEPADLILLATGEVDRDQRVRAVGRVREKLAAARELFAQPGISAPPVVVLVPAADQTDGLQDELPAGAEEVPVLGWERIQSLAELGASTEREGARRHHASGPREGGGANSRPAPQAATAPDPNGSRLREVPGDPAANAPPPGEVGTSGRRRRSMRTIALLLGLLAAIGAGAGGAWWTGPQHWEALRRGGDYEGLQRALGHAAIVPLAEWYQSRLQAKAPVPDNLVFDVVERRTADGRPCAVDRFRAADAPLAPEVTEITVASQRSGFFRSAKRASLCKAVYRISNQGEQLVYLYFAVRPLLSAGAHSAGPAASRRRAAALPPGASLAIDLELRQERTLPLGADLVVLAAWSPAPQLRRAFAAMSAPDQEQPGDDSFLLSLADLAALGLTVKGASHAILR